MKNLTVFFPGKFHPPHLGHAKTILELITTYEKVVIGISEDVPEDQLTTVNIIQSILEDLFAPFENVSFFRIKGVLINRTNKEDLPEFDLLLSGNPKVLDWAENYGIPNKFVPRAEGYFFSGTEIRDELRSST